MTMIKLERIKRIEYLKGIIAGATKTMELAFKVVDILDHEDIYQECNSAIVKATEELEQLEGE